MSDSEHDDPPNSPEDECALNGHVFEGYDTFTEMCSFCGMVRERVSRAECAPANEIHTCWTAADHAFDSGVCIYCGKVEATLTPQDRAQYAARRGGRPE